MGPVCVAWWQLLLCVFGSENRRTMGPVCVAWWQLLLCVFGSENKRTMGPVCVAWWQLVLCWHQKMYKLSINSLSCLLTDFIYFTCLYIHQYCGTVELQEQLEKPLLPVLEWSPTVFETAAMKPGWYCHIWAPFLLQHVKFVTQTRFVTAVKTNMSDLLLAFSGWFWKYFVFTTPCCVPVLTSRTSPDFFKFFLLLQWSCSRDSGRLN